MIFLMSTPSELTTRVSLNGTPFPLCRTECSIAPKPVSTDWPSVSNSPLELVRRYLTALGERRLEEAWRCLDANAFMIFPQGRFEDLAEMTAAMEGRYRHVGKTHETWDVMSAGPDAVVVTTGSLHGINLHGVSFQGIRFCDRFVIRDGRIAEQHVWNDLAESGVLEER